MEKSREECSSIKLLDCPHCGCGAGIHSHADIRGLSMYAAVGHRVECEGECHSMTCYWHTKEEAIAAWNNRTKTDLTTKEIMRKFLEQQERIAEQQEKIARQIEKIHDVSVNINCNTHNR